MCIICWGSQGLGAKRDLEAQALLDEGFLDILADLGKLGDYWAHMLREYPDHPAAENPLESIPIMLYGHLPKHSINFCPFWGGFFHVH